ncbi:transcription elongation mitochondrial [Brachionus plicatilis]|uniref:Transcription elongation mitochondrial n=1 Tax=Brachionus plicatilis TaxID=10195 RepID=A0A3M7PD29_BRAPC|nr:transcription elongation mitochondrial [Brachionus plicatilis]
MIFIIKLIKNSQNELRVLKRVTRYLSTKSSKSDQTFDYSFDANPESVPVKEIDSNILKSFGKKSIELPKLDSEFVKSIDTITSLDLSYDSISWIHIQNDGTIIDWNFVELDKNLIYNPDFNISFEYLNKMYEQFLPQSSNAYIFEDKRYKAREAKMLQFVLKLQKNEIMLESLVKSKLLNQKDKKLFKMNSSKVAKKFNILVGNERVRAADLVQFMIRPKTDFELMFSNFLLADSDKYYEFFSKAKNQKEPLAINYLQASCFFNLLKDFNTI